jgi:hypothetical protein
VSRAADGTGHPCAPWEFSGYLPQIGSVVTQIDRCVFSGKVTLLCSTYRRAVLPLCIRALNLAGSWPLRKTYLALIFMPRSSTIAASGMSLSLGLLQASHETQGSAAVSVKLVYSVIRITDTDFWCPGVADSYKCRY